MRRAAGRARAVAYARHGEGEQALSLTEDIASGAAADDHNYARLRRTQREMAATPGVTTASQMMA